VERSSIKADLHRRDFTINTLAIRLDSGHYGTLLDFYGGEQDLKDGLIRALHSLSFIEDPTRIMRAARFEQRLGFTIEARTEELIENALPMLAAYMGIRSMRQLRNAMGRALGEADESADLVQNKIRIWTRGLVIGTQRFVIQTMRQHESPERIQRQRMRVIPGKDKPLYTWRNVQPVAA